MAGSGYAFVEVLSECPTHLDSTPRTPRSGSRRTWCPIFPLGVKKDTTDGAWLPGYPDGQVRPRGGSERRWARPPSAHARFAEGFPTHLDPDDISLKLAGSGGDGAQTAAMLIARGAINEGFDATHIPSYGPESRGGTSLRRRPRGQRRGAHPRPRPRPHVLVAFNAPSLAKFGPTVQPGGTIIYDSSVIRARPDGLAPGSGWWECPSQPSPRTWGRW